MHLRFHCVHDTISLAMVEDLARACREAGHQVSFSSGNTPARPLLEAWVRSNGFTMEGDVPDVLFVMDFRGYTRPSRSTVVVDLGHGLGNKAAYYYPGTRYASDYVVYPSQFLCRGRDARFLGLGMPKLDRVWHARQTRKPKRRKVVLIAPTHNDEYTCLALVKPVLAQLAKQYRVIIKPHEYYYTSPLLAEWRKWLTEAEKTVEVVRAPNIADLLIEADVVVSDVSSVFLEALGLGIPTVVCESPVMRTEIGQVEHMLRNEYQFQHEAVVARAPSELIPSIRQALTHPKPPVEDLLSNPGAAIPAILSLLPTLCRHPVPLPPAGGPPDAECPKPSSTSGASSTSSTSAT